MTNQITLKKISIGAIFKLVNKIPVKKAMEKLDHGDVMPIGRIVGQATGSTITTTDYGDSIALIGMFKFTDTKGNEYSASKCYLPDYLAEQVNAAVGTDSAPMFAYDITAQKNEELAIGYEYFGESKIQMADPFSQIEADIEAAEHKQIENKTKKK